MKVGFICPYMIVDPIVPTYLGMTIVVGQALCLTSQTHNTCYFTDGNKAAVCVQQQT